MKKDNAKLLKYVGLATQWMVLMLLGAWGGYHLDNYWHLKIPVFLILFPLAALIVSLVGIIKEFTSK